METLKSKRYFRDVSEQWDVMGNSYFGEAPRRAIYNQLNLQDGQVVVDVGSGTGYLLEGLDSSKLKLMAVDQSPEMLDVMRRKFGSDSAIDLVEGQSESIPLPDRCADVVMANMYVHHVERPAKAIEEMVRLLKPGGQLIFTDMDKHNHEFLVTEQYDRWMGFERSDIVQWMEAAGLGNVIVDCVGFKCCAQSNTGADEAQINIFIAMGTKENRPHTN